MFIVHIVALPACSYDGRIEILSSQLDEGGLFVRECDFSLLEKAGGLEMGDESASVSEFPGRLSLLFQGRKASKRGRKTNLSLSTLGSNTKQPVLSS